MSYDKDQSGEQITKDQIAMLQCIDSFLTVTSLSEDKFIQDLKFKFKQYGDRMYLSHKQLNWLERIYERFERCFDGLEGLPHLGSIKSPKKEYVPDDVEF